MNFATIDRKSGRVLKIAPSRGEASTEKGLIVNLDKLEAQPPGVLATLYTQFTNQPARKSTRLIMRELAQAITEAGGGSFEELRTGEGPVAICRRLISQLHGRPRSEVIAACVKEGVKASTARTQYQKLYSSGKH